MSDLIKEGKILHWGISEANEEYLRRAHAVCPVTAVENRYSMMARQYGELFPALEELNVGFVAFSPMANGFLSGKYGKGVQFDKKYDYRSNMPQENAKAAEIKLTYVEVKALDEALDQMEMSEVFGGSRIVKKPRFRYRQQTAIF